jgi:hypothetical protein
MSHRPPPSVNPLLLVLIGALSAAALPYLGRVTTGLILSVGLLIYGLYIWRGGRRPIGGLLLAAALAIALVVLLRG